MSWGEALRLTERLSVDTESHVAVALAGWEHPVSRVALTLMDKYDFDHTVLWVQGGKKGQKPKPYPRPWPTPGKRKTAPTVTQEQVVAALRFAGHAGPIPTETEVDRG